MTEEKEMLFRRLESWTQWRFGEGLGRAFVATTGPTALPAAVQAWAGQHRDAVWQLVWLKGPAVLCGLALVGPEQFAVMQYANEGAATENIFSYATEGSWRMTEPT